MVPQKSYVNEDINGDIWFPKLVKGLDSGQGMYPVLAIDRINRCWT
jgi:hypothetical protein